MTWLVLEWRNLPVSDFGHLEKSPISQNPNKRYLYAPHLFGVPISLFPHKGSLKYRLSLGFLICEMEGIVLLLPVLLSELNETTQAQTHSACSKKADLAVPVALLSSALWH